MSSGGFTDNEWQFAKQEARDVLVVRAREGRDKPDIYVIRI